ncbi:MAD3 protein, partial [Pachyramphus minor]|nr:MAD3 protein [Pachyramphus minor]
MEPAATTSIQVLLQAAEFLEHRDHRHPPGLAEAEHGYASLCPARSRRAGGWRWPAAPVLIPGGSSSHRSVHNALEKHRYRGVRGERRGRAWLCPLEEQELRAQRAKDRLRDRQRSLRRRLEWLLLPTDGERARADSLDSSQLSEPSEGGKGGATWSGQERKSSRGPDLGSPPCPEDAEVEVDGVVFGGDLLHAFSTGRDHSYSSLHSPES